MIRFNDAVVLAYTKLRTHRIRTGIVIAISGLLFGLIGSVIIVAQGVFDSVDRFSDEGLNNRTIVSISHFSQDAGFNEYDHTSDPEFIAEVEATYKAMVLKKQTAAKKYSITYDSVTMDPSPIGIDSATKQKIITDNGLSSVSVQDVAFSRRAAIYKPFDINAYIAPYSMASLVGPNTTLQPAGGTLSYMKNGKESFKKDNRQQDFNQDTNTPVITVLEGSLTKPFISVDNFDNTKGEIPAIFPYSTAEKLLGLESYPASTPTNVKLDRLAEVRSKIGEVSASYCYRNPASLALLSQAIAQKDEIARNVGNKEYEKPKLLYGVPSEADCAAVAIVSDTRTTSEKKQDANQVLYEKEIGTYIGEPEQHKLIIRGVGVANDPSSLAEASVSSIVQGLLGSWLGYGTLVIPDDMLAEVPAEFRPATVFESKVDTEKLMYYPPESYLVEFTDKAQARSLMQKTGGVMGGTFSGDVMVVPFGSGVLIVDELRDFFQQVLVWVFLIVGTIAIIILGSMIGRTVAEGRRESAVFRAIGAKRSDIGAIYGMYALLLSLRTVLFAAVMAIVLALIVEFLFWHDATLGARLAYAASDTTREFHLFSLNSVYLLAIVGVIIIAGLIASIIPILLGARRSPIKDMRDDT